MGSHRGGSSHNMVSYWKICILGGNTQVISIWKVPSLLGQSLVWMLRSKGACMLPWGKPFFSPCHLLHLPQRRCYSPAYFQSALWAESSEPISYLADIRGWLCRMLQIGQQRLRLSPPLSQIHLRCVGWGDNLVDGGMRWLKLFSLRSGIQTACRFDLVSSACSSLGLTDFSLV